MTPERIAELALLAWAAADSSKAALAVSTAVAEARAEAYADARRICMEIDLKDYPVDRACNCAIAIERAAEAARGRA